MSKDVAILIYTNAASENSPRKSSIQGVKLDPLAKRVKIIFDIPAAEEVKLMQELKDHCSDFHLEFNGLTLPVFFNEEDNMLHLESYADYEKVCAQKETPGEQLASAIMSDDIKKFIIDGMNFDVEWYNSEILPNLHPTEDQVASGEIDLSEVALELRAEVDYQRFEVSYTGYDIRDAVNVNGCWKINDDDGIEIFVEKPFNTPGGEAKPAPVSRIKP